MLSCTSCEQTNRAHRGYCRACGEPLQPVCRGCRFVNERGDRFCGGCGSALAASPVAIPRPAPSVAPTVAGNDELAELFAPIATPDDDLPAAGITQGDLDRMFGGVS